MPKSPFCLSLLSLLKMQNDNVFSEKHSDAMKKGEKVRVLLDLLFSEIGASYEDTTKVVWDKIRAVHDAEQEAMGLVKDALNKSSIFGRKKRTKKDDVSVSD